MPPSPHEFLKVFLQEVRICVPFHLLKFFLCCRPIALCVLCMDTGDWVYKVNRVINRLMIETQDLCIITFHQYKPKSLVVRVFG